MMRNVRAALLAAALYLVLIMSIGVKEINEKSVQEAEMDAQELQYDCDGPFILIDQTKGLAGVYIADKPIAYIPIDQDLPTGEFRFHIIEDHAELHQDEQKWIMNLSDKEILFLLENGFNGTKTLVTMPP